MNILHSSKSNEWYTPPELIERIKRVLGGISLDPASCEKANETVRAAYYFDKASDGLKQRWFGKVFCNPPYGKNDLGESNQNIWSWAMITKFELGEFEKGVLLVNSATGNKWFRRLWDYPICFPYGRIRFIRGQQPTHSNALVFFGCNRNEIIECFEDFGRIVFP